MSKELDEIKPYIKFHLQHAHGMPLKDKDVDAICNKDVFVSINQVGNDYVLVAETRLMKREEYEDTKGSKKGEEYEK